MGEPVTYKGRIDLEKELRKMSQEESVAHWKSRERSVTLKRKSSTAKEKAGTSDPDLVIIQDEETAVSKSSPDTPNKEIHSDERAKDVMEEAGPGAVEPQEIPSDDHSTQGEKGASNAGDKKSKAQESTEVKGTRENEDVGNTTSTKVPQSDDPAPMEKNSRCPSEGKEQGNEDKADKTKTPEPSNKDKEDKPSSSKKGPTL